MHSRWKMIEQQDMTWIDLVISWFGYNICFIFRITHWVKCLLPYIYIDTVATYASSHFPCSSTTELPSRMKIGLFFLTLTQRLRSQIYLSQNVMAKSNLAIFLLLRNIFDFFQFITRYINKYCANCNSSKVLYVQFLSLPPLPYLKFFSIFIPINQFTTTFSSFHT